MIIVGTIVFGLGGIVFAVPIIFFYVTSSALTFASSPSKRAAMAAFDKIGPRDIWQVLANGGVGAVCAILYFVTGKSIWFFPYLASLGAAAADTWATEIGTMSRQTPVSIVTLKKAEAGHSGAVTVTGMVAALAGSALVTLAGYFTVKLTGHFETFHTRFWLAVLDAGFAGSILDSILGGSVQAMYRCSLCNRVTERRRHCGDATIPISGFLPINNDVVNFISVLFGAVAVGLIFLI